MNIATALRYIEDHAPDGQLESFELITGIITTHLNSLVEDFAAKDKEIRELVETLRPFAQPDLKSITSSMCQGNDSPVYGKNNAVLILRDFVNAALAVARYDSMRADK